MKVFICALALLVAAISASPVAKPNKLSAAPNRNTRIINGTDVSNSQEFPYQVSLQYCVSLSFLNFCSHSCGGVIISPSWILTAGHCATEAPLITGITSYKAVVGLYKLDDENNQTRTVVETIVHPDFEGGVNPNDISLFRLDSPLELNSAVQSIALPASGSDFTGFAILSGWGMTGGSIFSPILPNTLQKAELPLVTNEECESEIMRILKESGSDEVVSFDSLSNICTSSLTKDQSACSGDSGGPLAQDGKVIGLVSWGLTPCAESGAPSVYTRTSTFVEWIQSNVDENITVVTSDSARVRLNIGIYIFMLCTYIVYGYI